MVVYPLTLAEARAVCWTTRVIPAAALAVIGWLAATSLASI